MVPVRCHARDWRTYLACGGLVLVLNATSAQAFNQEQQTPPIESKQETERAIGNKTDASTQSSNGNIVVADTPRAAPQDHTADDADHGNQGGTEFWPPLRGFKIKITDSFLVLFTFVLSIATVGLWVATHRLWTSGETQIGLSKEALVTSERAYVSLPEIDARGGSDLKGRIIHWDFTPVWQNSGKTPTKYLRLWSQKYSEATDMPEGFDFHVGKELHTGTIGSNKSLLGQPMRFSDQEIFELRYIYIWGWARYFDIFKDTIQHNTIFCYRINFHGDPFNAAGDKAFTYPYFRSVNCSDEDCAG